MANLKFGPHCNVKSQAITEVIRIHHPGTCLVKHVLTLRYFTAQVKTLACLEVLSEKSRGSLIHLYKNIDMCIMSL